MARRLKPEPGQGFRSRRQYARDPSLTAAAAASKLEPAASAASIKRASGAVASPAPRAVASARASNEPAEPRNPAGKNVKKDDVDNILDQVPQGLRKRFGF